MKPSHLDTQNVGFLRVKKIIRDEFVHDSEMKLNNAYSKRYQTRISSTRLGILKFQWIDWPHNQDSQSVLLNAFDPKVSPNWSHFSRCPKTVKKKQRWPTKSRPRQEIIEMTFLYWCSTPYKYIQLDPPWTQILRLELGGIWSIRVITLWRHAPTQMLHAMNRRYAWFICIYI